MAVPRTVDQKAPGCTGLTLATLLMIGILVVLLMLLGIVPSPFTNAPTQATTSTKPRTGLTTETPGALVTQQSSTAAPSTTSTATQTSTVTHTPTPTTTPTPKPMPFVMRGTPQAFPNALLHSQYACKDYLFIGGEVLDLRESPILGLTVTLNGSYGGESVEMTAKSGDVTLYGESGFEFALANKQIVSDTLYIQLWDENGEPASSPTYLHVDGTCEANLIIINFKQVR